MQYFTQKKRSPASKQHEMGEFHVSTDIEHLVEVIKSKLYFGVTYSSKTELIKNTPENFYFTVDEELIYLNYYLDFGPLNISCLYKYCMKLQTYMQCPQIQRIIHYTSSDPNRRANAAYLIGSFCVVCLNMDPKCIYRKLLDSGGPFRNFVDASQGISRYTLRLIECLQGLHKASSLNFFNFLDFNVAEYDLYDKIQNGDFNWLVPRKFLALIGPIDKDISCTGHSPSFYIKYFLKNDVRTVIRLNNKLYDPYVFIKAGIDHFDLFFPDGTTPPKPILLKFLQIAEKSSGAIAVHCKAGLGRTGSLIGAYIIKHYKFTAKEAIAWMRICRPGSVIGQQQAWLEKVEPWLWKQGEFFRMEQFGEGDKLPSHKYGIYSKVWQLERRKMLMLARKRTQSEGPPSASANRQSYVEYDVLRTKQNQPEIQGVFKKVKAEVQRVENEFNELREIMNPRRLKGKTFDEQTQGDRLNEIKMRKYIGNIEEPPEQKEQRKQSRNAFKYVTVPRQVASYDVENKFNKQAKTKGKQYYSMSYDRQGNVLRNR